MRNTQQQQHHLVIVRNFSHNSTTFANEPEWGSLDHSKLPRQAFADMGDPEDKSTWKYPHHWVENGGGENDKGIYTTGTLYLHEGGLNAAWSAANGARSGEEASQAVKDHLQAHRQALGLDDDNSTDHRLRRAAREAKNKGEPSPWYTIKAAKDDISTDPVEIEIYADIGQSFWGEGISAKQFVDELKPYKTRDLNVRINSNGGDVSDGLTIYSALNRHVGKVTCYVDGFAISSASFIALAGDKLVMPEHAMLMIHDPWVFAIGNATELRKQADTLQKIGSNLVDIYVRNSNLSKAKVTEMMAAETWITAQDALKYGLCQEVTPGMRAAAHFDLSRFKNVPKDVLDYRPKFNHAQSIAAQLRERVAHFQQTDNPTPAGRANGPRN